MREYGRCTGHGDAGEIGGSWRGSGTACGVIVAIVVIVIAVVAVEVVFRFDVVVDGEPGREWSKRDVI